MLLLQILALFALLFALPVCISLLTVSTTRQYTMPSYGWEDIAVLFRVLPEENVLIVAGFFTIFVLFLLGKTIRTEPAQWAALLVRERLLKSIPAMTIFIVATTFFCLGTAKQLQERVPERYPAFASAFLDIPTEGQSEEFEFMLGELEKEDPALGRGLRAAAASAGVRRAMDTGGRDFDVQELKKFLLSVERARGVGSRHPLIRLAAGDAYTMQYQESLRYDPSANPVALDYLTKAKANLESIISSRDQLVIPDVRYAALANLGNVNFYMKDYSEALHWWKQALDVEGRTRATLVQVSVMAAHIALQEWESAFEIYNAIENHLKSGGPETEVWRDDHRAFTHMLYGYALIGADRLSEAEAQFRISMQLFKDPMSALDVALVHLLRHDDNKTISYMEEARRRLSSPDELFSRCESLISGLRQNIVVDERRRLLNQYVRRPGLERLEGKALIETVLATLNQDSLPCARYRYLPQFQMLVLSFKNSA
jgi:tetratricopeptide (TPR) repeat protein